MLAAPVALAVVLMAVGGAWRDADRDARLETRRLTSAASTIAALSAPATTAQDRRAATAALAAPGVIPGVIYRRIELADGRRLAESGAPEARAAADMAQPGLWPQLRSRTAQVAAPILAQGRTIGRVVLLTHSAGLLERLLDQWLLMLAAVVLALAGGIVSVRAALRRLTAPMRKVAEAMTAAAADPGAAPALTDEHSGPAGALIEGFNTLIGGLGRRQAQSAIQLRRLKDELAARSAAADQAVRDEMALRVAIALEFRAPLRGLPSRLLAGHVQAGRAAAGLLGVLDSLLDPEAALEAAPMDLAEIAEDALGLLTAEAAARGLDLALYVDPAVPLRMTGDAGRVRRVIARLTSSALAHTQAGGVLVEIEPDRADRVRISVRDTGPGFTARQLAALSAPVVGRPLGLAACKQAVEAMGGAFKASGGAGRGATVAISLPVREAEAGPAWPEAPIEGALAVIDHPGAATRRALSRYLARAGYRPVEPGAEGEVAILISAPEPLETAPPSTVPTIVLASGCDARPPALISEGRAQATLPLLFHRSDLARLLGDLAAGRSIGAPGTASKAGDLLDPKMLARLKAMAEGGRADIVERARAIYQARTPKAVAELRSAAEAGDLAGVGRLAHSLLSLSRAVGAASVSRVAAAIEQSARTGRRPSDAEVSRLSAALNETLVAMEAEAPPPVEPVRREDPEALDLMADLDRAIERNELSLVYQPQYDRDGREIQGVEALIRWVHPTRGAVAPMHFIPLAEAHGRINRVTSWVLNRALAEIGPIPGLPLAFNASALEFAEPGVVDRIGRLIEATGFDPRRLEVEITETAILNNEEQVKRNMTALKAMGLKVALDDFGAGYSSLGHLRRYPFDKLKIDQEFITDCTSDVQSATVVHAVVSIGRALGMKVIAEGVETEAQRQFLKIAGVHAMQGYLFGKPMTIEALKALLTERPRAMAG